MTELGKNWRRAPIKIPEIGELAVKLRVEELDRLKQEFAEMVATPMTVKQRDMLIKEFTFTLNEFDTHLELNDHPELIKHPDYQNAIAEFKKFLAYKIRELKQVTPIEEEYSGVVSFVKKLFGVPEEPERPKKKGFDT